MTMKTGIRVYSPFVALGIALVCGASPFHAGEDSDPEPMVDVHVAEITRMTLQRNLTFYGRIVPELTTGAHHAAGSRVAAIVAGQVVAVEAIEGEAVQKDDVLVRLDSRQAEASVRRARAAAKQAKAAFGRQQTLAKTDDTSSKKYELAEQQHAEAEAALKEVETRRALLDIKSPLNGTVLQVNVQPGEAVMAGTVVAEIQDLDRLVAEVQVPASQLAEIQAGQVSTVQSSGKNTRGKISFVGMRINPATGTAAARIAIPAGSGLYSGQFIRARVVVEEHAGMVVPASAVIHQPDGSGVIAVVSGDSVTLQQVRPGIEDNGRVAITGEGIRAGQKVVTREAFGLPDGARIRIIGPWGK